MKKKLRAKKCIVPSGIKYNVNEELFDNLDIDAEYELILKKQSKLSARMRDIVSKMCSN